MEGVTARLLQIHGQVQGVGYRAAMQREADRLQLSGWVRNRSDGSVEALVCGPAAQVEQIIAWARHGRRQAAASRSACRTPGSWLLSRRPPQDR